MASEEEVLNLSVHREVLRSFSLSDTKTSVEQNLCHSNACHDSLMCQRVVVEDAPEMALLSDAKQERMDQIIEEDQAHRAQVAALSQRHLQAIALLEEHQVALRSLPERHFQEPPTASSLSQLR